MAKLKLFNPKPKDITGKAVQGILTQGATVGTAYVVNTSMKNVLSNPDGTTSKKKLIAGIILQALGIASEIYVEEPHLRSVGRGMGAAGSLVTAGETVFKNNKSGIGLSGADEIEGYPHNGEETFDFSNYRSNARALEFDRPQPVEGVNQVEGAGSSDVYEYPVSGMEDDVQGMDLEDDHATLTL